MNRWQALTDIVKAFIEHGSPGYAFLTVLTLGLSIAIGVGVVLLTVLH